MILVHLQTREDFLTVANQSQRMSAPKRVLVTGAAGNIGYALCPLIAQYD